MRIKESLLQVGYDKNGEMDFGILGTVGSLSNKQIKEFREMIIVAIWCAEDMWRRNQKEDNACCVKAKT